MKKVCIQAGHKGMTTGATGAPGERTWTTKVVPMIAKLLKERGVEVYTTDAFADKDNAVITKDWDLFLSVHYDADVYNDRGGFTDYPEPYTDYATKESQRIAKGIADYYFSKTGISQRPNRSNANTRFYYMWKALSTSTPCVLIECGVGWRKPEDYEILRDYDKITLILADSICRVLDIPIPSGNNDKCQKAVEKLEETLAGVRENRDMYRDKCKSQTAELNTLKSAVKKKDGVIAESTKQIVARDETITSLDGAFKEKEMEWKLERETYEKDKRNMILDLAAIKSENEALKKALKASGWKLVIAGMDKVLRDNEERIKKFLKRVFEKPEGGDKK